LAKPYVPESTNTVIAQWPAQDAPDAIRTAASSLENAIQTSQKLIARAAQPSRSYLYGLAHSSLAPWINSGTNNAQLWINWARIQQQKHDFSSALEALEMAITLEPKNVNAHLIKARTHLIQGDFSLAKKACEQIVVSGDFLSASVCNLEVTSHLGTLTESYENLQKIATNLRDNDSKRAWINSNLADMAARQGLWQESEFWLDAIYTESDISTLIEWADIKLRLNKHLEVADKLSAVVKQSPSSEDAILIRLTLAEQHLKRGFTANLKQQLTERMVLREQRRDLYHASDLAIFYLDIQPNPERALHWAEINWQQAREYKDQELLTRAKTMSGQSPKKIQDSKRGDE